MDRVLIEKKDGRKTVQLTIGRDGMYIMQNRFGQGFHGIGVDEKDLELLFQVLKEWKYPETF